MSKQPTKDEKKESKNLRIVLMDDDLRCEVKSVKYNKPLFIVIIVVTVLAIIVGTYFLTSRTILKHTIPGYPSSATKALAIENLMKIDSLQRVIDMWTFQVANIQRVVTGRDPLEIDTATVVSKGDNLDATLSHTKEDSLLRDQVKQVEQFSVSDRKQEIVQIDGMHFYPPVKGMVTEKYNKANGHPFIDVAAPSGTTVCATLDGTVFSAGWSDDTGYTIQIQHNNEIISIYKHNEKLLKKTGDKVKAGTPIAILGNTGSLSTGAHLHFELWHKGEAVDPSLFISF